MEEKEVKIEVPEGYEIDKENSTFECIRFRRKESHCPTWKELKTVYGYYIDNSSEVTITSGNSFDYNKATYVTKGQAEAVLALAQITQLVAWYNRRYPDTDHSGHVIPALSDNGRDLYPLCCLVKSNSISFTSRNSYDACLSREENRELFVTFLREFGL